MQEVLVKLIHFYHMNSTSARYLYTHKGMQSAVTACETHIY